MTQAPASGPTYRLQMGGDMTFARAAALVPYLDELGIRTMYVSPVLTARKGSEHGYDVTDPAHLSPSMGGERPFRGLCARLRERGMGLMLDIVPNHMAASSENPWWRDVLARGRASSYAKHFDIRWEGSRTVPVGKVLVPILAEPLHEVLRRQQLRLERRGGKMWLAYHDHRLPLAGGESGTSRQDLLRLLEAQNFRLADWRQADEAINYRRFFDITELVSLRIERPDVFDDWHRLVSSVLAQGLVTGLRVDHVDGLADPAAYLRRLRSIAGGVVPIVVEKILSRDERLRSDWPVQGTTGYDFLDRVNDLFVDPEGLRRLTAFFAEETGEERSFEQIAHEARTRVARSRFTGEMRELAAELIESDPGPGRDRPSSWGVHRALVSLTASLPVYRTYATPRAMTRDDERDIRRAVVRSRRLEPGVDDGARRAVASFLLAGRKEPSRRRFIARWQQYTGPVMARGVEDTTLYSHNVLASRNEVGCATGEPVSGVDDFHGAMRARRRLWPATMNATATHDTKRGEDARTRIAVISEVASEWQQKVRQWMQWNRPARRLAAPADVPDAGEELFIYQVLAGSWPLDTGPDAEFRQRLAAYLVKAAREAKIHTSWHSPDTGHEKALLGFVEQILTASPGNKFLPDFTREVERIAFSGALNSLSQVLLKIAAPGVPDFYQGTEMWDLSFADPDNRRPVDFRLRAGWLDQLEAGRRRRAAEPPDNLLGRWRDGRIKLWLTWKALRARRRQQALFVQGDYIPLSARSESREHVVAFARRLGGDWVIAAAPRLMARRAAAGSWPLGTKAWGGAGLSLPATAPGRWICQLTGRPLEAGGPRSRRRLALSEVFGRFPVALMGST